MLVANLAEMAAEEVGANQLLLVGAYYHDVGKTSRPYFLKKIKLEMKILMIK